MTGSVAVTPNMTSRPNELVVCDVMMKEGRKNWWKENNK